MKELVVISGKGGTGKTSLTAAFAVLADRPVIADCDVDAPDLHLVLSPRIKEHHDFLSGHEAVIRQDACTGWLWKPGKPPGESTELLTKDGEWFSYRIKAVGTHIEFWINKKKL